MTETSASIANSMSIIIPAVIAFYIYNKSREDIKELSKNIKQTVVDPAIETLKSQKRDISTLNIADDSYFPTTLFYISARATMLSFINSLPNIVYIPHDVKNALTGRPFLKSHIPTRSNLFQVYRLTATDTALNYIIPDNYTQFKENVADIEYENYRIIRGSSILGFSIGLSYTPVPHVAESALILFFGMSFDFITSSIAWLSDGVYAITTHIEYYAWTLYKTKSDVAGFSDLRASGLQYIDEYLGLSEGIVTRDGYKTALTNLKNTFSYNSDYRPALHNHITELRRKGLIELLEISKKYLGGKLYNNLEKITTNLGTSITSFFYSMVNYLSYVRTMPDKSARVQAGVMVSGMVVSFSLYFTSAKIYTSLTGIINILSSVIVSNSTNLTHTEEKKIANGIKNLSTFRNITREIMENITKNKGEEIKPETLNKAFQRQGKKTITATKQNNIKIIEENKKNLTHKAESLGKILNNVSTIYDNITTNKTINKTIEKLKDEEIKNLTKSELATIIEIGKDNKRLRDIDIMTSSNIKHINESTKYIDKKKEHKYIEFVIDTNKKKSYMVGALGNILSYHTIKYSTILKEDATIYRVDISNQSADVVKTLHIISVFIDNNIDFWKVEGWLADAIQKGIVKTTDSKDIAYWAYAVKHARQIGIHINI